MRSAGSTPQVHSSRCSLNAIDVDNQPPVRGLPGAFPLTTSSLSGSAHSLVVLGLAERQARDGANDDPEQDVAKLGTEGDAETSA